MKKILILAMLFLSITQTFAHFLWVETNLNGEVGKEQEIKVYFGEYTYGEFEKPDSDAFNAVDKFTLLVVEASGKNTVLKTTAKKGYYSAKFTPSKKGTYTVVLNNNKIDVIDYTKYDFGIFKTHYHATAKINVGNKIASTAKDESEGLTIKDISTKTDEAKLQVFYKNKPLAKAEVVIFVADQWSKKIETNEEGIIEFSYPWKTKYVLEVTKKEEVPGVYNDKPYEFIWHCATYAINK